jgi:hypothetical protein
MNVLIWFQQWPSHLWHGIAIDLKKRYGVNSFGGIAIDRRYYEFLRKQKEVRYDPLVYWQERFAQCKHLSIDYDYISRLEQTYGFPSLWPYVYADRDLVSYNATPYSHDDLLKILQGHFKFTIELLEEFRPDFVIMPPVDNMEMLVLCEVACQKGIPTLIPTSTRVGDRITISRDAYEQFSGICSIYEKLLEGTYHSPYESEAAKIMEELRAGEPYADYAFARYLHQRKLASTFTSPARLLTRALRYWYYSRYTKDDYMCRGRGLRRMASDELRIRIRTRIIKRAKVFEEPRSGEQYVLYPLHFEPEMSTMVLAPFHLNQAALIENIAKALPVSHKLYVKEHPLMVGARPLSYYRMLSRIPNLRLVDPLISPFDLIKNSSLVVVITGTTGWEALLLRKPVITLGRVFYNSLENVRKAESVNSLPELIKDTMTNYKHDEEQLMRFVTAILEGSFSMRYAELRYEEDLDRVLASRDLKVLADALATEMGLGVVGDAHGTLSRSK